MIDEKKIEEIAAEYLENGDVFLVSAKVYTGNKIKVLLDGDNGVKIDQCAKLSRHIESFFDRESEDFEIEVSSVGVGTPLLLKRQYNINIGRMVLVVNNSGQKIKGKLIEVGQDSITLEKEQVKKKKKKDEEEESNLLILKFDEIKETKVQVSFK
jgi:ribosome maturation factor RimP